jgi:galactonate dehydratase
MKITAIKPFLCNAIWRNYVFVKVETDEGIHGWGEASMEFNEDIAVEAAIRRISEYYIGKDPRTIELHWNNVHRNTWYYPCYVIESALGGIDIALWDILGKILNTPVYQLLGGACRDKVQAYANGWYSGARRIEDYAELALKTVGLGYKHIKFDPFWPSDLYGEPEEIRRPKDIIRVIREAVGPDIHLLIEAHGRFAVDRAIQIGREIEEYRPYFLEDPVRPEDIDGLARVTTSINVPVASGERTCTHWGAREILEKRAVSIYQPDVIHIGGISEMKKVASMASAHFIPISIHAGNGPVQTAADIQVGASIRNFLFVETFYHPDKQVYDEILKEPLNYTNGAFDLPQGAGLGIDLDERALLKHPPQNYNKGCSTMYDTSAGLGIGSGYGDK